VSFWLPNFLLAGSPESGNLPMFCYRRYLKSVGNPWIDCEKIWHGRL